MTNEQQEQFERYVKSLLDASIRGDGVAQKEYAALGSANVAGRLAKFKAWATEERTRTAQEEVDVDERVTRDKSARVDRDVILREIEALTRL